MNDRLASCLVYPLITALLISAGCSKPASAPALAPEKIPAAMNQAFAKTDGETKGMALDIVAACQGQDTVGAFNELQKLSQRPDLTPEQRATIARAMATLMVKLRADSESGSEPAQAALHQYISTR